MLGRLLLLLLLLIVVLPNNFDMFGHSLRPAVDRELVVQVPQDVVRARDGDLGAVLLCHEGGHHQPRILPDCAGVVAAGYHPAHHQVELGDALAD